MKTVLYLLFTFLSLSVCKNKTKPHFKQIEANLTSLAYKEIGTIFDQDKDGRLSRDELMHITYEGEPLFSEETVDKDIDLLDFNGDGYISFESKDSSKK